MDGWMDRWMDGWMDGWMAGWMDGWMDGWVDEWMILKCEMTGKVVGGPAEEETLIKNNRCLGLIGNTGNPNKRTRALHYGS